MISRRSTRILAEIYETEFGQYHSSSGGGYYTLSEDRLYDFLFDNDYDGWFCNVTRATRNSYSTRQFKEFIMKLHTGESLYDGTKDWTWEQRQKLGQRYLFNLIEDILILKAANTSRFVPTSLEVKYAEMISSIRLDGYDYRDGHLLAPESDVLDVQEESGVLRDIYSSLGLKNQETVFHHLRLSEEHYLAGRWDDSISNSRKFLECILSDIAVDYGNRKGAPLSEAALGKPVVVRDYLEKEGLLEKKEKEAVSSIYSLLSETGSHPYIAQPEQARLLRHLSLTLSQFVLLRFKGKLAGGA
jgi:hypothetical protein